MSYVDIDFFADISSKIQEQVFKVTQQETFPNVFVNTQYFHRIPGKKLIKIGPFLCMHVGGFMDLKQLLEPGA